MGTVTERHSGEIHYNSLVDFVTRGEYHAAISNDGQFVIVHWGSPLGYPTGCSCLSIRRDQVPELIACLKASTQLKG